MIPLDCEQGSDEWLLARCGRATASEFSAVLAKGQGKMRASYARRVLAERLTGKPTPSYSNPHLERGHEQEPLARMAYEAETGNLVVEVGFIPHEEIMAGCSPDGLIGDDGGVEIKSVIPTVQVETLLRGDIPPEHKPQVYGNLWITRRKWWDFVSFCPDMPPHLQLYVCRVLPDAEYIATLEAEVRSFLVEVDALEKRLNAAAASTYELLLKSLNHHPATQS